MTIDHPEISKSAPALVLTKAELIAARPWLLAGLCRPRPSPNLRMAERGQLLVGRRHDPSASERTRKRQPDRQRLDRMQDIIAENGTS
jgi:hypothetical protein